MTSELKVVWSTKSASIHLMVALKILVKQSFQQSFQQRHSNVLVERQCRSCMVTSLTICVDTFLEILNVVHWVLERTLG